MAGTFTQLYIHIIFAVKFRRRLIKSDIREDIERFICGIVRYRNHKVYSIYAMPDHIHILVRMKPNQSVSDLVREIKSNSSAFINSNRLSYERFSWQGGYSAFAVSDRGVAKVIAYIKNQEDHHRKRSFEEEYIEVLKDHKIEFDERYVFCR
ncbi:MAG: IS200/IS605 family transposase [Chitinophagales bacterium]|nr:IS200/IS605 family transposase [Chitinophagales bacterium]